MSVDIDMQSYAGANLDPAAGGQQVVDTNSYQQEVGEYQEQLDLNPSVKTEVIDQQEPNINPQAENFRALREEVDRIKAEREAEKREHQLQLDMLRANLAQQHQQAPQPQVQERQFLDGMKEEDIPTVGELRKEWAQKEQMYQARLEELQVAQQHSDYAEVLDKYLTPLVKQKPHLAEVIRNSTNKASVAYELGLMAKQAQERMVDTTRNENAQRIVENSKKPGTLSQAGGQGALSKADYFASMSDQEFMKFASRNLEGI